MRKTVAYIFLVLYAAMFISNAIFMHGHVTSDGKFIMHVHPYNLFNEKHGKKHTHTPQQLKMLDAAYYCTYTAPDIVWIPFFILPFIGFIFFPLIIGRSDVLYAMKRSVRGPPIDNISISGSFA